MRVIVLLSGRDGAGKTTTARDLAAALGPGTCRVVALGPPTEVEQRGFYFERWLRHLSESVPVTVFDRSWYNRALVERVMGFCSSAELDSFFATVPEIEAGLIRSGYAIVKVFFSISRREQVRRLEERRARGDLSRIDSEAIGRRDAYALAERELFARTSTDAAPWFVLPERDRSVRCAVVLEKVRSLLRP